MTRRPAASDHTPLPVPHRLSSTLIGLVLPLALIAATVAVAMSWAGDLPDPVAVHWGADGADGFGSLGSLLWPLTSIGVACAAGMWAVAFFGGRATMTRRMTVAMAVWFAVFQAVMVLGALAPQRGLADAAEVGSIGWVLALALILPTVAAALVAAILPGDRRMPATDPVPQDAPRADPRTAARATWVRSVTTAPAFFAVMAAALVVLLVATVLSRQWWLLLMVAGTAVLVATNCRFTATVDHAGLTVRSALGVPRIHLPADEVLQARRVQVSPFGEFGGWGYRSGPQGRTGVVLRKGEAIEVERTGGRTFVITVDDAAKGAALLNTVADLARRP